MLNRVQVRSNYCDSQKPKLANFSRMFIYLTDIEIIFWQCIRSSEFEIKYF